MSILPKVASRAETASSRDVVRATRQEWKSPPPQYPRENGPTTGRPSAWVLVRRNDMGGEDGIALGSEMSGGIHDVFFEDNTLRKGASAVRFKANLDRGGTVERVRVRRFKVEDFETLFDDPGGFCPLNVRDEAHAARIVLVSRVVQALGLRGRTHG